MVAEGCLRVDHAPRELLRSTAIVLAYRRWRELDCGVESRSDRGMEIFVKGVSDSGALRV